MPTDPMPGRSGTPGGAVADATTRDLFRELVTEAAGELGAKPSPLASGYLVELLDVRVRARPGSRVDGWSRTAASLAESLLTAMLEGGAVRTARLRALGDRALFAAGFFGESLRGRTVGVDYYADVGSTAYARLSSCLADRGADTETPALFRELAVNFHDFVEVLAEVGERARGRGAADLLRIYDRYLETGSHRDRSRLLRRGLALPPIGSERPQ